MSDHQHDERLDRIAVMRCPNPACPVVAIRIDGVDGDLPLHPQPLALPGVLRAIGPALGRERGGAERWVIDRNS